MEAKRKQALQLAMDPEKPLIDIATEVEANYATVRSWVWRARQAVAETQQKGPAASTD